MKHLFVFIYFFLFCFFAHSQIDNVKSKSLRDIVLVNESIPIYSDEFLDENSGMYMYQSLKYINSDVCLWYAPYNRDRMDGLCFVKNRIYEPSNMTRSVGDFINSDTVTREIDRRCCQQFLCTREKHCNAHLREKQR